MKTRLLGISAAWLLATSLQAQPVPTAVLTVKSYTELTRILEQFGDTLEPGTSAKTLAEMQQELGLSDMATVDHSKPWQVAVWAENTRTVPGLSIRIPTTDFDAFKRSLVEGKLLLGTNGNHELTASGTDAIIWMPLGNGGSPFKAQHDRWSAEPATGIGEAVQLTLTPREALRDEIVQFVGLGRFMMAGALSQEGVAVPGVNPAALTDVLNIYLDAIEGVLNGLESWTLSADADTESITFGHHITPLANSALAEWLVPNKTSLESVVPYWDAQAPMAFALQFGNTPSGIPALKELIQLTFEMQGMSEEENTKKIESLVETFLPLNFAGTFSLKGGVDFSGVYQFPEVDLTTEYATIKTLMKDLVTAMTGEDKPYKSADVQDAQRKIQDTTIDRMNLAFNFDAPMFQFPGQRETIEAMWPDGEFTLDIAHDKNHFFMGSPDGLTRLLNAQDSPTADMPLQPDTETVAFARLNLLEYYRAVFTTLPMIPPQLAAPFQDLDTTGTDVYLKANLDNAFDMRVAVPLKLFKVAKEISFSTPTPNEPLRPQ